MLAKAGISGAAMRLRIKQQLKSSVHRMTSELYNGLHYESHPFINQ